MQVYQILQPEVLVRTRAGLKEVTQGGELPSVAEPSEWW